MPACHEICISATVAAACCLPSFSPPVCRFSSAHSLPRASSFSLTHLSPSPLPIPPLPLLRSPSRAHFPLYFFDALAPWISFPLRTSNRSLASLPGLELERRTSTSTSTSPSIWNSFYALNYWTHLKGAHKVVEITTLAYCVCVFVQRPKCKQS